MVVANYRRLTLRTRIGLEYINTVIRPKHIICAINSAENRSVNWQFLQTFYPDPQRVNYERYLCSQADNCDSFALVLSSDFCIKCRKTLRYSRYQCCSFRLSICCTEIKRINMYQNESGGCRVMR